MGWGGRGGIGVGCGGWGGGYWTCSSWGGCLVGVVGLLEEAGVVAVVGGMRVVAVGREGMGATVVGVDGGEGGAVACAWQWWKSRVAV